MHSHRLSRFAASPAGAASEHPAEPFLRAAGLKYARLTEDPAMLMLQFVFKEGTVSALLHRHPDHELMVFNLSLPVRPSVPRALCETGRLCHRLNGLLPTGRFALDESDGEVTFRSGHFFGPEGLQTDAFDSFFRHCLDSVSFALPAFLLVAEGLASANDALASVLHPHSN
jgi:hypothetical protein